MIGTIGDWQIEFLEVPRGRSGRVSLKVRPKAGGEWREMQVGWVTDAQGILLELPAGMSAYDIRSSKDDDGATHMQLLGRGASGEWNGLRFVRQGEEIGLSGAGGARKGWKLKAQMPGKILKILVEAGADVERGQSLMVMEAMKMENEIKATGAGKVSKVAVVLGQAVETGALLLVIE